MVRHIAVPKTTPAFSKPRPETLQCPAFAGTAILAGRQLHIRHADGELTIRAPYAFLSAALKLCDGTRPLDTILAAVPRGIDGSRFAAFLDDLLDAGALVDGSLLTAHALKYAHQAAPYGRSAPPRETDRIGRRTQSLPAMSVTAAQDVESASWMKALEQRISTYAFAETDLAAGSLAALLWALCGVTRATHERLGNAVARRTIASAGALYLVQPYVVLRRPVDGHAAGVYRVRYPAARQVALEPVGNADTLIRAFVQPWHVRTATGAIFLAGDVELAATRYRNRAVQYLYTEAGAALQNGALAAASLELGYATLGCYDEAVVQTLCGIGSQLVLGAATFGALRNSPNTATGPELEFSWLDTDTSGRGSSRMPSHCAPFLARARLRRDAPEGDYSWGADPDPETAYQKASAEAIERLAWHTPAKLAQARANELPGTLDPSQFIRYRPAQYRRHGFPFQPFSPSQSRAWFPATRSDNGQTAWIPADLVYARPALLGTGATATPPLTYATTSGCAAAGTARVATERALLELVERDAFMRHWLAQQPGTPLSEASLPTDIQARLRQLRSLPCEAGIQLLPSRWAHVFLAWARSDARHFTTVGAAASLTAHSALSHALAELESRVFAWASGHAPAARHPAAVRTPADHFELYGQRRYYRRADALFHSPSIGLDWRNVSQDHASGALVERMTLAGIPPLIADLTTPECVLDHGTRPLHVVKVFVPTLVPLSFGTGLEPLGMVERPHRGAMFPHPFP